MIASRIARRMRSAVRHPAHKLLTPGPTTAPLMHPIGPQVPDDRHVQQVIDLCMRIGEVLLSSGEGSGETTETMLRVANTFGLSAVDVDITFSAVTICCHRGMAATPITSMRVVTRHGLDLTLLATVYRLVEDVERGRLGLREAAAVLDEAITAVHPYRAGWRPRARRAWPGRSRCCWARRGSRCWWRSSSPR
jgi:Putative threonine/serine exporter